MKAPGAAELSPVATQLAPLVVGALWEVGILMFMMRMRDRRVLIEPGESISGQTNRVIESVRAVWIVVTGLWKQHRGGSAAQQQDPPRNREN